MDICRLVFSHQPKFAFVDTILTYKQSMAIGEYKGILDT